MEKFLKDFDVPAKRPSEEALRRWRSAVALVRNRRRRFRMVADLDNRSKRVKELQERIRVALYVQKSALQYIDAASRVDIPEVYKPAEEFKKAGFNIDCNKIESMFLAANSNVLEMYGGIEEIARCLSVSLDTGVSSHEKPTILDRQKIFGINRFKEKPSRKFLMFLWEALQDKILLLLSVCAVVSMVLGVVNEGWPSGMFEGLGIFLCIVLVMLITSITDYKQYLLLRDLTEEKNKISVQVTREKIRKKMCVSDLVVGDVVHLAVGDQVPADGLYVSGHGLLVDESALSGESSPVHVSEEKPFLLAGTKILDGSGKMLVTSVGKRTTIGRLMETLGEWEEHETPLQVKLNGVATIVGKIGLVFSLLVFVVLTIRFLLEKAFNNMILVWAFSDALSLLNYGIISLTVFVTAVPEDLPLAVIISLVFTMRRLMNEAALVRHPSACEVMGSVSCICTDKTGTLTTNHMEVARIWICDKLISGSNINGLKSAVSNRILDILLRIIFKNTSAEVVEVDHGKETILGSPTESALLKYGLLLGFGFDARVWDCRIVKFEPFHPIRKKMSVILSLPGGELQVLSKGAPEIILGMCDKIFNNEGESVLFSEDQRKIVMDIMDQFANEALRTLCFACKEKAETSDVNQLPINGYTLVGVIGIKNPVRPGVRKAVQACLDAGISVCMVTGDNMNTAKAVAKECGILTDDRLAIYGSDLHYKNIQDLKKLIPKIQVIAHSLPADKHTFVTHLRGLFGEVVAVTGDGINDAPALREADVGLAMGITGSEAAKENADVVIKDDNFMTVVNLVKEGRAVYLSVQKILQFQLNVNFVVLLLSSVCACISGSAFITPFQLLWVNIIVDILGSLVLATEKPTDASMQKTPSRRDMDLISPCMWRNIVGQSFYEMIVLLIFKFDGRSLLKLNGVNADSILDTFIFNAFVFFQVFNEINCREVDKLNVFHGILGHWIFLTVTVIIVILQVIIVEFLGSLANTVPLSWELWIISILVGSTSIVVGAVLKGIPLSPKKIVHHHDGYSKLPSGPEFA